MREKTAEKKIERLLRQTNMGRNIYGLGDGSLRRKKTRMPCVPNEEVLLGNARIASIVHGLNILALCGIKD